MLLLFSLSIFSFLIILLSLFTLIVNLFDISSLFKFIKTSSREVVDIVYLSKPYFIFDSSINSNILFIFSLFEVLKFIVNILFEYILINKVGSISLSSVINCCLFSSSNLLFIIKLILNPLGYLFFK